MNLEEIVNSLVRTKETDSIILASILGRFTAFCNIEMLQQCSYIVIEGTRAVLIKF